MGSCRLLHVAARVRALPFARIMCTAVAVMSGAACRSDQQVRELLTERAQLQREIAGYRALDDVMRRGLVQQKNEIVLSVTDTVMRSLLQASMPVKVAIPGDVDVQLDSLRLDFVGNVARVRLNGTVARISFPRATAQVELHGGIHEFRTDSAHALNARIRLDRADVTSPSGVPDALGSTAASILQNIVDRALPQIAQSLPAVVLPIRVDKALTLPGFGPDGALAVRAASSALTISASRVVTFQHRLIVVLKIERGTLASVDASGERRDRQASH